MSQFCLQGDVPCSLYLERVNGYYLSQCCDQPVCVGCFPQVMSERISSDAVETRYECPYCWRNFRSFPSVTSRNSLVGPIEQVPIG